MKNMRNHLFGFGASCVLALSMALAQDQAGQQPAAPQPAAAQPPKGNVPAQPRPAAQLPQWGKRPSSLGGVINPRPSAPSQPSVVAPVDSPSGKAGGEAKSKTTTPSLKFDNAPTDIILQAYAQETGKTLLIAPDAPKANITLKSQPDVELTKEEYIEAIEVVLSMNGIVLEPFGEKFVKVFARKTVRTDGIKILMESPEHGHPEKTRVVSQMIQLKSITVAEAQKALEGFKKPDGMFQTFERTNSILVTDTQENVNRMLEIVKFIDQPLMVLEEVNVRSIRFAKADDIKKRLEELVAESQKQTQAKEEIKANVSGAPGFSRTTSRPLPPGLTRLGAQLQTPVASTPNEILQTLVSDADRGMIRGKVQILSDERSNQLIIVTRSDNMAFFDKIITVLDVETAPDVKVEVQRLEFADAEEVSTMLNDLIGNATSKKDEKKPAGTTKGAASTPGTPGEAPKSMTLAETLAARATSRPETQTSGEPGKSKLGQLSKDNIKILADKRTNALVMMGSPSDLLAIKEVIKGMDIQLSQVLIETVVLQVELTQDIKTGIDWVKRVTTRGDNFAYSVGGGGGTKTAQNLFDLAAATASNAADVVTSGGAGIEYFATSKKLNLDAVVSASKSDSGVKVLSSPVLLTVDNKEATIEATSMRYLYKGLRYSGSSYSGSEVPDFEQRDIGLTVKVTPRINPNGMVVLTIEEKYETVGADQTVGTEKYPTVNTRKVQADVSVENMQTVILGGLVDTEMKNEEGGIPILKDIPVIGKYIFGYTALAESRKELLIFLTPYVMDRPEQIEQETRRRKDSLHMDRVWTQGWSASKVADPEPVKEKMEREKRKWALEDGDKRMQKVYDKALKQREEKLRREDEKERAKEAKEGGLPAEKTGTGGSAITIKSVTETTEVIKPAEGARQQPAAVEPPPRRPEAEPPKKAWWHW